MRNERFLLPLMAVWWGCSAWNSIAAKKAARNADSSVIALMSVMSNILGVMGVCVLCGRRISGPGLFNTLFTAFSVSDVVKLMLPLATGHAIGLFSSYMGLIGAKVAIVQAIKALEPILAMLLSVSFGQFVPNFAQAISACIVVLGVLLVCVNETSYTYTAILWVGFSSVSTQVRNQFMKKVQTRMIDETRVSDSSLGLMLFVVVSCKYMPRLSHFVLTEKSRKYAGIAFPLNLLIYLGDVGRKGLSASSTDSTIPWQHVMEAGLSHFAYNLASFGVLSLMSPSAHSLANTSKRAVVIVSAAWVLSEPVTLKSLFGFVLVFIGLFAYKQVGKLPNAEVVPTIRRLLGFQSPTRTRLEREPALCSTQHEREDKVLHYAEEQ